MDVRIWSALCIAMMVLCVILELLTPTMGGFTIAAVAFSGGSIYLGFRFSDSFGYLMVAANVTGFPLALWLGLYLMRRSPLIHTVENESSNQDSPDARPLTHLLGLEGKAITPLRPAGSALIGDARVDVVTEGKFVDPNTQIKVIRVEGSRVVVEPAS
jgi:membrane-bound ClpP family serine protease